MYSSRCNCNNSSCNSCSRNGERILVNQGCGCNQSRRRCACQNTYRPGCGCGNHHNDCSNRPGCGCNNGCGNQQGNGCRPCPPRPCPPRPCPRPSCEDRCRAQYRQCMRNCRCREEYENRGSSCAYDYDDFDTNE